MVTISGIAIKNLKRKPFRSVAIFLSVCVVTASLFSVVYISLSVHKGLENIRKRLGADIIVVPADAEAVARTVLLTGEPTTFYMDSNVEKQIERIEGIERVASEVYLQTAEYSDCCEIYSILLIGFDPEKDFTIMPWISDRAPVSLSSKEVITGMDVALNAYSTGSTIRLYGIDFKVAGMLEQTGLKFVDNSIFIPLESVKTMILNSREKKEVKMLSAGENQISSVLVRIKAGYSPANVALDIMHSVPGVKTIVVNQLISSLRQRLSRGIKSVIMIVVAIWTVALILIGLIFAMTVNERQRELSLFRAMGAKQRDIFRLVITEAWILSLLGSVAGSLCSMTFIYLMRESIKSSFNNPLVPLSAPESVMLTCFCMLVSLLTVPLTAVYPAVKFMHTDPHEAIYQGG